MSAHAVPSRRSARLAWWLSGLAVVAGLVYLMATASTGPVDPTEVRGEQSQATVVTNSAIIVFREGLEGVLILAAITALRWSACGAGCGARCSSARSPAFAAGVVTWVLAQTLLRSLDRYGEKLEAVVGLVAIGVLLLITELVLPQGLLVGVDRRKFHRQRNAEQLEHAGFISAQAIGLFVLGLTSVYREGFETVLFLQSLQLQAGTATVLEGAGARARDDAAVAGVTFYFQRKLPYKKMLIVTGVLIGFVLVVMVGQTARTMQGTGWVPDHAARHHAAVLARRSGSALPDAETIGAQVARRGLRDRLLLPRRARQGASRPQRRGEQPGVRADAPPVETAAQAA